MSIRVLFTCGREPGYPRNSFVLNCLHEWFYVTDITEASDRMLVRHIRLLFRLLFFRDKVDVIFVGFVGHLLVLLLRVLRPHTPIVFDAFISLYDTLCFDRKLIAPKSLAGRFLLWLDAQSCRCADLVIADTAAHAAYFHQVVGVPEEKLRVVLVGSDERIFHPIPSVATDTVKVLFYGTFLPLHGVDVIVQAAGLLKHRADIKFCLIGPGTLGQYVDRWVQEQKLSNLLYLPPVPLLELPNEIAKADICLGGHFGTSEKAGRVIAGKTFQCIAMQKATIVGDNPANQELLTHRHSAYFCRMNDPQALATAIVELADHPALRETIAQGGRQVFIDRASFQVLSVQLEEIIATSVKSRDH